ncbi:MAG: tripartite tricarboxylate transporter TctB family protein [Rhodospirillales bacterium CG15_BIG_FIL_POST_REV_8_21_14_020_66_15]|nr:MAG: tripartite tricarboxylate transporter TctB family protein [Rhodospirillales bacterium CG15_BIG_FIL_POST_REV_8_21_14_020_66_15]
MSDRIFGGIGVALACFFIWQATTIELSFISDPVGPRTFPVIIGIILGFSSLIVLIKPDLEPEWPSFMRLFEIGTAVAVMVAYALLLSKLGFVITTALASAFLTWRLGTRPVASVISGIATALGIYVVFHLVLGLSLARGPLGF